MKSSEPPRYFLDTNVLIDFLASREPFAESAALLFECAVQNKVRVYIRYFI
jgi:predicted nucleic acid-binding protein